MNLHLTAGEARLLLEALDRYLPELEFELARVKRERYRHDLVELDEVLLRLRERLARCAGSEEVEPGEVEPGEREPEPPTPDR
ncbi:MAG TPA: hypothetical protein VKZ63_08530 [Kofleriaceae bacterium]|nr:hypothetical protein [Kofleriaceae bacterium]